MTRAEKKSRIIALFGAIPPEQPLAACPLDPSQLDENELTELCLAALDALGLVTDGSGAASND